MSRRDEVLQEMGLGPVWRLKGKKAEKKTAAKEEIESKDIPSDWQILKAKVRNCTDCKLRAGCTQTVFGVGDEKAEWLLVGEAPGAEEDRLGEPFVGQAGRLLDQMLLSIGMKRGEHVVEQPAGLSHEGLALGVFLRARRLADEQPLGVDVAHAGHRLVARPAQATGGAGGDVGGEIAPAELRDALQAGIGGRSFPGIAALSPGYGIWHRDAGRRSPG